MTQTTGYPFLRIAKRHGVAYADVLALADQFDTGKHTHWSAQAQRRLDTNCKNAVLCLCRVPIERRHLVAL